MKQEKIWISAYVEKCDSLEILESFANYWHNKADKYFKNGDVEAYRDATWQASSQLAELSTAKENINTSEA